MAVLAWRTLESDVNAFERMAFHTGAGARRRRERGPPWSFLSRSRGHS